MAAVVDYDTLCTAINDLSERSYSAGDLDRFIGQAESEIRIELGPHFAKEASTSLSFTTGAASLPAGYIRTIALTHATYGELDQKPLAEVRARRIADTSGIPDIYAIHGSQVLVAPTYTGNLTFDYEGTLAGLTSGNPTNWLILNAPLVYLDMCMGMEADFNENDARAAAKKTDAISGLRRLSMQATIGKLSRTGARIPGATP